MADGSCEGGVAPSKIRATRGLLDDDALQKARFGTTIVRAGELARKVGLPGPGDPLRLGRVLDRPARRPRPQRRRG